MIEALLNFLIGTVFSPQTIILLLIAVSLLYWIGTYNHDYFSSKGIPGPKPLPCLGNSAKWLIGKASFCDVFQQLYRQNYGCKIFGLFDFMAPLYVVCDFELIKQICIKDFEHFTDRRFQFNEETDPIFSNAIFALNGIRWKNMRAILSPAFTGSKMRGMFKLISDYCIEANETLDTAIGPHQYKEVELKDLFTKISSDVIASCAFGLDMNVLRDGENDLYLQFKHLTHFSNWQWMKFALFSSLPRVCKLLGLRLFDSKSTDFMKNTVREIIETRERHKIIRYDMVHLLMQARDQKLKFEDTDRDWSNLGLEANTYHKREDLGRVPDWTLDDFVAQCTVFVFGGLDTVSNMASFMAHELALNPSIQSMLQEEIDLVLKLKAGRPIEYEDIMSLVYLDRVVTETLRKWPQALFLDRICTKDYNMEVNNKMITIERGTALWIPAFPIQRDPKYFPDPEKFDPDRFAPDQRDNLKDFVHLGFGIGPRNCLGNRFALLEVKTVFFWLLSKFDITRSINTQEPLKLGKSLISLTVEEGFFVNLKKRK